MEADGSNAPWMDRICALSAAAEFIESAALHPQNSSSSFVPLTCTLAPSESPQCNTSTSETPRPPKFAFRGICNSQTRGSSAEESSDDISSELSSLTSPAKGLEKVSKFAHSDSRSVDARLSHLATFACSNQSEQIEYNSLNIAPPKIVKKLRSARCSKHSSSSLSSLSWITMQTPTTVCSTYRSQTFSSVADTYHTARPSFFVPSLSLQNAPHNNFSRPVKAPVTTTTTVAQHCDKRKPKKVRGRSCVGTRLEIRCIAIHKFLTDQSSCSEMYIRQIFGNSPDTSKALRILLKQHRVKRFGAGGRAHPFVYMADFMQATTLPVESQLEKLNEARTSGLIS